MEYISKEDVLSKLYLSHKDVTYIDKNAAADRIKKIPSIDIVFCKECKSWLKYDIMPSCRKNAGLWRADDFCSYGEREGE